MCEAQVKFATVADDRKSQNENPIKTRKLSCGSDSNWIFGTVVGNGGGSLIRVGEGKRTKVRLL